MMSSMPQGDAPGESGAAQGGAPGQQRAAGQPGGQPGQPGGQPGQPGDTAGEAWAGGGGRLPDSPVDIAETRVTGRRIVQYIIDAFLVAIVPSLVSIPFDHSSRTSLHIIGGFVWFVLMVVFGLFIWVLRPHSHSGQTFGMQLLGLRVISKDGGPASVLQLVIRWVALIIDTLFFYLVGFITMLCSRYRQRVGDHLARTLVVEARNMPRQQYAHADRPGQTSTRV
jgi:uncharacterized RDD family membrane protein YckC